LGEHGPRLFDTTGNVSPTIWCDGRIVGGWTQRESGEIALALLEDVGSEAAGAIEAAAGELGAHVGPLRLAPRARGLSQVERQLTR
ncbi:MAG: winged helix DNA-binding protein, partial [Pseudonocardia sp.]|nr:winged helix DNA-binding protein [Pseudonocardia sp.]